MLPSVAAHVVVVQVLDQRPAQRDVDHLLAAADPEHGDLLRPRLLEQSKLCLVELAVDRADLLVLLLSVEGRVHVPAPREPEAVHLRERRRARRKRDGLSARRFHPAAVRAVTTPPPYRAW